MTKKIVGLQPKDKVAELRRYLRHSTSHERILRVGFRGTKVSWVTKDGVSIRVENMDTIHLLSTVGYLWRWAISQAKLCKTKASAIQYDGTVPTEGDFLRAIPTWKRLQLEVDRRKVRFQLLPEYQGRADSEKPHLGRAGGRNNPRGTGD
jgi:hypothetical protein